MLLTLLFLGDNLFFSFSHCSLATWTVIVCFLQAMFRTAHLSFLLVSLQCSADTRHLPWGWEETVLTHDSPGWMFCQSSPVIFRVQLHQTPLLGVSQIRVVWEERECRDGWYLHSVPWRQRGSCPTLAGQHRKWPKPGVSMNLVRVVVIR